MSNSVFKFIINRTFALVDGQHIISAWNDFIKCCHDSFRGLWQDRLDRCHVQAMTWTPNSVLVLGWLYLNQSMFICTMSLFTIHLTGVLYSTSFFFFFMIICFYCKVCFVCCNFPTQAFIQQSNNPQHCFVITLL